MTFVKINAGLLGHHGPLTRGLHSLGTSAVFVATYGHILKPLILGTTKSRSLGTWLTGILIFIVIIVINTIKCYVKNNLGPRCNNILTLCAKNSFFTAKRELLYYLTQKRPPHFSYLVFPRLFGDENSFFHKFCKKCKFY